MSAASSQRRIEFTLYLCGFLRLHSILLLVPDPYKRAVRLWKAVFFYPVSPAEMLENFLPMLPS